MESVKEVWVKSKTYHSKIAEKCNKHKKQIAVHCVAMVDMFLFLPTVGYILVATFSDEKWTEQNSGLTTAINGQIGLAVVIGIIIIGIMRLKAPLQITTIILMRLYTAGLLLSLNSSAEYRMKFVIWVSTSWILLFNIALGGAVAVCIQEDFKIQETRTTSTAKTWIPSLFVTGVLSLITHLMTDSPFNIGYFALFVFGFEVMLASFYFCTVQSMIESKNACEWQSTITENKELKTVLREPKEKKLPPEHFV